MEQKLLIYNTLTRTKERFTPLHAPNVGMYVCGPTVYGDPHLGHARPAITFDILFRYLKHLGYKVRYVRNITDVGHLEHDADEGDDKIEKKARLEQLEPMEIAQYYTNRYHDAMEALNVLPPSIEPHAQDISSNRRNWFRKFWTMAMPTRATALSTSISRSITRIISTVSSPDVTWRTLSTRAASWLVSARRRTRLTSPSGRRLHLSTSCAGLVLGAMDSLDGTASVLRWDVSTWAVTSIFMVAAWI